MEAELRGEGICTVRSEPEPTEQAISGHREDAAIGSDLPDSTAVRVGVIQGAVGGERQAGRDMQSCRGGYHSFGIRAGSYLLPGVDVEDAVRRHASDDRVLRVGKIDRSLGSNSQTGDGAEINGVRARAVGEG